MDQYRHFVIKKKLEDFKVNENLFLNMDYIEGYYCVLELYKLGISTFDAIEMIALFFGLETREINYAGLKDDDGETRQLIQIEKQKILLEKIDVFNKQSKMKLFFIGYTDDVINIGDLAGNSFHIKLRELDVYVKEYLLLERKFNIVFPNYFGPQRFGLPNLPHVTHKVGKALLDCALDDVYRYINLGNPGLLGQDVSSSTVEGCLARLDLRRKIFYLNAYESYCYNERLSKSFLSNNFTQICLFDDTYVNMNNLNAMLCYSDLFKKSEFCYYKSIGGNIEKVRTERLNFITASVRTLEEKTDCNSTDITLEFSLPSGTYATLLLYQLDVILDEIKGKC